MAKPLLEKLYQANRDKLEMITISTDYENIWKRKPAGEVSWHEWNDHKSAREISIKYGVSAIPTFIIISPEGKIEKKCVCVGLSFIPRFFMLLEGFPVVRSHQWCSLLGVAGEA
jgi:hypothetical protein